MAASYIPLTIDDITHIVVLRHDNSMWMLEVGRFPTFDRAESYADFENSFLLAEGDPPWPDDIARKPPQAPAGNGIRRLLDALDRATSAPTPEKLTVQPSEAEPAPTHQPEPEQPPTPTPAQGTDTEIEEERAAFARANVQVEEDEDEEAPVDGGDAEDEADAQEHADEVPADPPPVQAPTPAVVATDRAVDRAAEREDHRARQEAQIRRLWEEVEEPLKVRKIGGLMGISEGRVYQLKKQYDLPDRVFPDEPATTTAFDGMGFEIHDNHCRYGDREASLTIVQARILRLVQAAAPNPVGHKHVMDKVYPGVPKETAEFRFNESLKVLRKVLRGIGLDLLDTKNVGVSLRTYGDRVEAAE